MLYGVHGLLYGTEQKLAEEVFARVREAERKLLARDLHDGVLQDLSYTAMAMEVTRVQTQGTGLEDSSRYQIEDIRRATGDLRAAIYDLRLGEERDRPLPRLVESLVEQNRRMVPDLKLTVDVEEGFPPEPLGDAGTELLRVLQETLTNARRHSGAQTVSVNLGGYVTVLEFAINLKRVTPDFISSLVARRSA